jgi:hypothetical protein
MIEYARLCEWFVEVWEERERQERCRRRVAEVLACLEKRKRLEILRRKMLETKARMDRDRERFSSLFSSSSSSSSS